MKLKDLLETTNTELSEGVLNKKKVDTEIRSFKRDNDDNGEDRIDDLHAAAEIFLDDVDSGQIKSWLEENGFDAVDYVASRL